MSQLQIVVGGLKQVCDQGNIEKARRIETSEKISVDIHVGLSQVSWRISVRSVLVQLNPKLLYQFSDM